MYDLIILFAMLGIIIAFIIVYVSASQVIKKAFKVKTSKNISGTKNAINIFNQAGYPTIEVLNETNPTREKGIVNLYHVDKKALLLTKAVGQSNSIGSIAISTYEASRAIGYQIKPYKSTSFQKKALNYLLVFIIVMSLVSFVSPLFSKGSLVTFNTIVSAIILLFLIGWLIKSYFEENTILNRAAQLLNNMNQYDENEKKLIKKVMKQYRFRCLVQMKVDTN